jgi:mRNA interferase YafQ
MALTLKTTAQFRRDYKRVKKRRKDMSLLEAVVQTLLDEKPLDADYDDHALKGKFAGLRECHIQDDWLFVYAIDGKTLVASNIGTHDDIFRRG